MNQALHFGDNDFSRLSFVFFQRGVQFCQAQRSDTLLQRQERHFKKIPPPKIVVQVELIPLHLNEVSPLHSSGANTEGSAGKTWSLTAKKIHCVLKRLLNKL